MNSNYAQICRTCMFEAKEDQTLHFIYDTPTESSSKSIADLLLSSIPRLQLKLKDELPKNICMQCLDSLLKMTEFQNMCILSECKLLQMIGTGVQVQKTSIVAEIIVQPEPVEMHFQDEDPLTADDSLVKEELNELSNDDREDPTEEIKINTKSRRKVGKSERAKRPRAIKRRCGLNKKENEELNASIESNRMEAEQSMSNATIVDNLNEQEQKDSVCDVAKNTRRKQSKKEITDKIKKDSTAAKVRRKKLGNGARKHVCEHCNKAFLRPIGLKIHTRIHTGEQPYLCSECGKAFTHPGSLLTHLERHSGVKRYECSDCPKKFLCLSDLYAHKKRHANVKPFACDVCELTFLTRYQLTAHKMHHNGEKPHKCEYCEKRFAHPDNARRHQRTHTGEKPYKCKYCVRAFAQSNDLIKHLRTHLGENVYKCEFCPKGFRLASELRLHFPSHKNDDEATRARNLSALQEQEAKLRDLLVAPQSEEVATSSSTENI